MTETGFFTTAAFGKLQVSSHEQHGFRPYQLFLASLAGCSGEVMKTILRKKRISVSAIHIRTKVEKNAQGWLKAIHLHFEVIGNQLDEQMMESVLKLTRRHCPLVQSVQDGIKITESMTIKEG